MSIQEVCRITKAVNLIEGKKNTGAIRRARETESERERERRMHQAKRQNHTAVNVCKLVRPTHLISLVHIMHVIRANQIE